MPIISTLSSTEVLTQRIAELQQTVLAATGVQQPQNMPNIQQLLTPLSTNANATPLLSNTTTMHNHSGGIGIGRKTSMSAQLRVPGDFGAAHPPARKCKNQTKTDSNVVSTFHRFRCAHAIPIPSRVHFAASTHAHTPKPSAATTESGGEAGCHCGRVWPTGRRFQPWPHKFLLFPVSAEESTAATSAHHAGTP